MPARDIRLWAVVRASKKDAADAAARVMWPDLDPAYETFVAPLIEADVPQGTLETGTYFGAGLQISKQQRDDLSQAFRSLGFPWREVRIISPGDSPNPSHDLWLFNGGSEKNDRWYWTYWDAIDALGLRPCMWDPDA